LSDRYTIERRWRSIVKSNNDIQQLNERGENELLYWKYPAHKMYRAISEPNLQTINVLGTRVLQKSNSFHELNNFKRLQPEPLVVKPFKPKNLTWLYVTRAQCYRINFTKTDEDLLSVFRTLPFDC